MLQCFGSQVEEDLLVLVLQSVRMSVFRRKRRLLTGGLQPRALHTERNMFHQLLPSAGPKPRDGMKADASASKEPSA